LCVDLWFILEIIPYLLTLIATALKKGENRGSKNCHAETMMNTKS
jgi:hypothetical protein